MADADVADVIASRVIVSARLDKAWATGIFCVRIWVCRCAGHSDILDWWVRPLLAGLLWIFVYCIY